MTDFKKLFPDAETADDPKVQEAMKQQSTAVVYAVMSGQDVPKEQAEMAKGVYQANVKQRDPLPPIKLNIEKIIIEAKERAGLIEVPAKQLEGSTDDSGQT